MSKKQKDEDVSDVCIDGLVEKDDHSERSEVCVSVFVHICLHITNYSTYILYMWRLKNFRPFEFFEYGTQQFQYIHSDVLLADCTV